MHERWRRWIYRSRPLARRLLHDWAIGIHLAPSPLQPQPATPGLNPALTALDSPSPDTAFVADPFVVRDAARYWMFFEAMNARTGRGEIALAGSADGLRWAWDGSIIREPFHLSFPCVIDGGSDFWMVPESRAARAIRLYVADDFPRRWRAAGALLAGDFVDPCVFRFEQRWWLFATSRGRLHLFHASHVHGTWTEHPKSPVVRDPAIARSAGRPITFDGRLVRLAQNPGRSQVRAFDVLEISPTAYVEREAPESPVMIAGDTWNAAGVHHLDACALADGRWVVAIDGRVRRNGPGPIG
jgi:hypothetical protein